MKAKQKRLDGVAENFGTDQRIRAALSAIKADDNETLAMLGKTAPKFDYKLTDPNFTAAIVTAEIVGVRLDRSFLWATGERWKLRGRAMSSLHAEKIPEDLMTQVGALTADLICLVRGVDIAAERLGLTVDQMMAFSCTIDTEDWKGLAAHIEEFEGETREHLETAANTWADQILELWRAAGGKVPQVE